MNEMLGWYGYDQMESRDGGGETSLTRGVKTSDTQGPGTGGGGGQSVGDGEGKRQPSSDRKHTDSVNDDIQKDLTMADLSSPGEDSGGTSKYLAIDD